MFYDYLLHTHLNIAMYNWKTINIVQSIRIIWHCILISWRSWAHATRCSGYLRCTGVTNVTTLVMIVIVISIARTNNSTGRVALDPRRYNVRWRIFLRFAAWEKLLLLHSNRIHIVDYILNFKIDILESNKYMQILTYRLSTRLIYCVHTLSLLYIDDEYVAILTSPCLLYRVKSRYWVLAYPLNCLPRDWLANRSKFASLLYNFASYSDFPLCLFLPYRR